MGTINGQALIFTSCNYKKFVNGENIIARHMFIKELNLYADYLQADIQVHSKNITKKKRKQLDKFKT